MMDRESFDEEFRRTRRITWLAAVVSSIFTLAVLAFFVWCVVALLNHFGVTNVPIPGA